MLRQLERDPNLVVMTLETLPITQADIADVVRSMPVNFASLGFPEVSRRALDVLISQKAMLLNARKEGLDKDPAVVRRLQIATDRVLSDAWLARKGDAAVTEPALHARYDRDVAGRPGPVEVRARLIVVPTSEEATSIVAKVRAGADFGELARTSSKDGSAAEGGDLGYVPQEAVSPEIRPVIFALAPGQTTAFPLRSPAGYYILRVEGRRQRATPGFEEARPGLEQALRAEATQAAIGSVLADIKMAPVTK
jgi:peptidyl-prolyl cis-trans isomerase C